MGKNGRVVPAPVQKIHRALLPLFVSLVVVCYLDRTSLAFAALQLCNSDWFNAKVYGLGSGIFYFGYVVFQIPSNLLLSRLGAKLWLPLITAAWGTVAICCVLISGPASFYALRFALGVAEAGAFPGMWHVCGQFYPNAYITVPYSVIEASIAISQILAAPAAAALLQLSGVAGLKGWQWLFLAEGLATLVLACILRWRLPASITAARFLTEHDKSWLIQQLGSAAENMSGGFNSVGVLGVDKHQSGDDAVLILDGGGSSSSKKVAGSSSSSSSFKDVGLHSDSSGGSRMDYHAAGSLAAAAAAAEGDLDGAADMTRSDTDAAGSSSNAPELTGWQQVAYTFRNKLILYLMLLKALKDIALDGLVYWVPMLVHALLDGNAVSLSIHGSSSSSNGSREEKHCGGKESQLRAVLLTAIPFGAAAVAALALGHSSEVRQERRLHIGLPLAVGGCAFMVLPLLLQLGSHVPAFIAVTTAVVAADCTTGPFWSWVHMAAAPGTGAVSLAAVNSVGKAGGFLGPVSFGLILHATGSYVPSILLVGAVLLAGGVMALLYHGERSVRYQKLPDSTHTQELAHIEQGIR